MVENKIEYLDRLEGIIRVIENKNKYKGGNIVCCANTFLCSYLKIRDTGCASCIFREYIEKFKSNERFNEPCIRFSLLSFQ